MTDFNLGDAFRMFDVNNLGEISKLNLTTGLKINLSFTDFKDDDIDRFFNRFDFKKQGQIQFWQFANAVLPHSQEYSALVNNRDKIYQNRGKKLSDYFRSDTRLQFQHFWGQIFSAERKFEAIKYELNKNFCLREVFNFFDIKSQHSITTDNFRQRLADAGFFATDRELKGLMYRFDRDKDSKVDLKDFKDQFYL